MDRKAGSDHAERSATFSARIGESIQSQVRKQEMSSLNDLEFAYAPIRDAVRDLREYL